MKGFCTVLLLMAMTTHGLLAQNRKVTMTVENETVEQVLKSIEKATGYMFVYRDGAVDKSRKVSLSVADTDVLDVLKIVFLGTGTEATIMNNNISLIRKAVAQAPLQQTSASKSLKTVKGTVLDSNGQSVIGAVVQVDGSQNGVVTDMDGNYTLENVPEGASIRFSCMGYVDFTRTFRGEKKINAILYEDSETLEEAVAVAFGTQKKESVIGAVTSIKPSQLKGPTSNLTTTLAGNVAGVISYQRTGEPGADDASFFIRGITTFGANTSPLILIDNIELTATDLARLQPDDIESFSIMKDATATALYGSRAANGVILVKTKEGRTGKAKINVRYECSMSQPTQEIELVNDPRIYMSLHNEAIQSREPLATPMYTLQKIAKTDKDNPTNAYPYTNWHDLMLKDFAMNHRANLNVSGGGSVARYYVAASVKHDSGILNNSGNNNYNNNISLTTYTLRSNVNVDITKSTELVIRLSGTFDSYEGPISGGSDTYKQIMSSNPVLFPAYYEQSMMPYAQHTLYGNYGEGDYLNPYAQMTKGYKEYGRVNMSAQFELKQDFSFITKGLMARLLFNTSRISYYEMSRYSVPFYYDYVGMNSMTGQEEIVCINPDGGTDYLNYSEGEKTVTANTYVEAAVNYDREFGRNGVSGMLVYQLTNKHMPNATTLQASLPYRNIGLSGRFTYNFDKRYFAEFNFGYNGSERFSKENRFGFFPAAGVAWLISNEKFFQSLRKEITNLKFRASYGLVGNDLIGDSRFLYMSQVNMNSSDRGFTFGLLDGGYHRNGISVSRYANPNVSWEVAKKTNFALELGWRNELNLTAEYYFEDRDNILQERSSIPASMGFASSPEGNVGAAHGSGVDIELNYSKSFRNNAWLQVRGNFTYARSEFVKYEENIYPDAPWKSHIGYPVNQTWGYIAESLFVDENEVKNSPTQFGDYMAGDIKYVDVNRDGVIDELDMVPIGYPTSPEIIYGFGVSAGYKGFDLSVFFQGLGRESFWIDYERMSPFFDTSSSYVGNNQLAKFIADDHWSESNKDLYAAWPRLASTSVTNNNQRSTWFMRDGSFLRLKQLEFGYTLPNRLTKKIGVESLRFYFSGTNLLCFSNFKIWDPEMGSNGLGYPVQRVFNLGVNMNF